MKKQLVLILFLIFVSLISFGQQTEKEIKQETVEAVLDWFENPSFDTTSTLDLSIMSELQDSGRLVNGLREGKWIIYDIDSLQIGNMVNVSVNEESFTMRLDPNIEKHIGEYRNNKRDGSWNIYESMIDKPPFLWIRTLQVEYKDGEKHGKEIHFQSYGGINPDTVAVVYYKNGIETGAARVFNIDHPNLLKEVYSVTDNGESYLSKMFYDDGMLELRYIDTVINNQPYFYFIEYFNSGYVKGTGFYNENYIDGIYKEYHTNGKLYLEEEYNNGKLWNVLSIKDIQGNKKKIGNFKNGNGKLIIYDKKGNKIETNEYIGGIKQEKE